jgi:hypothetical protein
MSVLSLSAATGAATEELDAVSAVTPTFSRLLTRTAGRWGSPRNLCTGSILDTLEAEEIGAVSEVMLTFPRLSTRTAGLCASPRNLLAGSLSGTERGRGEDASAAAVLSELLGVRSCLSSRGAVGLKHPPICMLPMSSSKS